MRTGLAAAKSFEFAHGPTNQRLVNVIENRMESRRTESTVVVDPTCDNRIESSGQLIEAEVTAPLQLPFPANRLTKGLRSFPANGWTEAHEELTPIIARRPWPECVPQEIEALTKPFAGAI